MATDFEPKQTMTDNARLQAIRDNVVMWRTHAANAQITLRIGNDSLAPKSGEWVMVLDIADIDFLLAALDAANAEVAALKIDRDAYKAWTVRLTDEKKALNAELATANKLIMGFEGALGLLGGDGHE